MQFALSDLAAISQGFSFRGRIEDEISGKFLVLQAKDLNDTGAVDFSSVSRARELPGKSALLLETGDVLIQPRGVTYRAALVSELPAPAIAAAPLYVLRPSFQKVRARYLVSFLNDPITQSLLRQAATGTHVPQVSRQTLEQLEVPLPALKDQDSLGEIAALIARKRSIEDVLNTKMLVLLRALAFERANAATVKPEPGQNQKSQLPAGSR
jgi:restriction endonuclease S subunit